MAEIHQVLWILAVHAAVHHLVLPQSMARFYPGLYARSQLYYIALRGVHIIFDWRGGRPT